MDDDRREELPAFELERRQRAMAHTITLPVIREANERVGKVVAAVLGLDESVDTTGHVAPDEVARAIALTLQVGMADVEKLVLNFASLGQGAFLEDGSELVAAFSGPIGQALMFGWVLRDEQVKAERAETAPAA